LAGSVLCTMVHLIYMDFSVLTKCKVLLVYFDMLWFALSVAVVRFTSSLLIESLFGWDGLG